MSTLNQLIKKPRFIKSISYSTSSPALNKSPQKKGVCVRVYTRSPKKPNSAKRKVTNITLTTG
jgi:small subunit ribosomal protein S12